ncbi:unnamed protein product [Acanthoscelides obtectus]|uniref:RNase H type-1 domain-containing protein n=1 Tax=Acanthoscelides obtectus TaxID=200917 RepID=A0A9P0JW80_ACAOB|nr:unnamed protein product [Acanthoscelides obtectus]CAK1678889.1 hypothetical protein AOBTE_LOCUS32059 [Acanthoscelides obtectus]
MSIRNKICRLDRKGHKATMVWVKAHCGITYNEIVDQLEKDSIIDGSTIGIPLNTQDQQLVLKRNLKMGWRVECSKYCQTNPTRYTMLYPMLPESYWHNNYKIPRKYLSIIIRTKIGHGTFPSHLARLNLRSSDLCDACEEHGDLDHYYFGCSRFLIHSNILYNNPLKCGLAAPLNTAYIFWLNRSDVVFYIAQFIKNSGMVI